MIASAVISLIYILCAVVLFFGVREQDSELLLFAYTFTLSQCKMWKIKTFK